MSSLPDPLQHRQTEYPIESLFLRRWSPRAMNGQSLREQELMPLFEAARWAPSTYNEQEWRFLYALRETAHWARFFDLLMEANQVWCRGAAALIVVISHKVFERNGHPNLVHSLDTGAAMQNLLLQATAQGLVAHPMAGFDRARARRDLQIPDDYEVEAMIAVGRPGRPSDLPEELASREVPTGRKPVRQITIAGPFPAA